MVSRTELDAMRSALQEARAALEMAEARGRNDPDRFLGTEFRRLCEDATWDAFLADAERVQTPEARRILRLAAAMKVGEERAARRGG